MSVVLLNQLVVSNLGAVRRDKMSGRDYLVAPVTMLKPEVLSGSAGPVYYPADQNRQSITRWNGMPIVNNHPAVGVSARTKDYLDTACVGTVLNVREHPKQAGVIQAEAWIDVENANRVDSRIVEALTTGQKLEVSTGLGVKAVKAEEGANIGGVVYNYVATEFEPDHLAILLDTKGACSVEMGCGLLVTNQDGTQTRINNELSHSQIHSMLYSLLRKQFTQDEPEAWIDEVFDAYFVFSQSGKLFKQGYTKTSSEVSLTGSPVQVFREVDFTPVSNGQDSQLPTKETDVATATAMTADERTTIVNKLIGGCSCYTENDRKVLNTLSDSALKRLDGSQPAGQEVQNTTTNGPNKLIHKTTDEAVQNAAAQHDQSKSGEQSDGSQQVQNAQGNAQASQPAAKPQTTQEWLDNAPEDVRRVFNNALAVEANERQTIINSLTDGMDDAGKAAVVKAYKSMSLEDLRVIRNAQPKKNNQRPQADYSGQSVTTGVQNMRTQITNFEDAPVPLGWYE